MRHLAAALPLLLGGCLQIAVLGEPGGAVTGSTGRASVTTGTSGGSTGSSATGGTGTVGTQGTSTGTGTGAVCGACAPGASCVDNYCQCPNDDSMNVCNSNGYQFCDDGACLNCEAQGQGGRLQIPGDGACLIPLATNLADPGCLAANSKAIFWMDFNGINMVRIHAQAGESSVVLRPGGLIGCLTADEDRVYFTDSVNGTIESVLLDGGAGTPNGAPIAIGQGRSAGIAVDATNVYWTSSTNNVVMTADKLDGTSAVALVKPPGIGGSAAGPASIAVDDLHVYWADFNSGKIMSAPIGGGPSSQLAGADGPAWIVVDANNVYWADQYGNAIKKAPKITGIFDGGAAPTWASASGPQGIAVDSQYVYWTSSIAGPGVTSVFRMPIDGGTTTELDGPRLAAYRVVVDSERVFWITLGPNSAYVYELTPK